MSTPDPKNKKVEADAPPNRNIAIVLVALVVGLLVVGAGLLQLFKYTTRTQLQLKEGAVVSKDLLEIQARDKKRLTTYDVADKKQGTYQIPIAQAMDLLVKRPELLRPVPLPPKAPAPPAATEGATPPAEGDQPATDQPATDKAPADKPAADDKAATDQPAADKAPADKPAADKAPADKPAEDKATPQP